MDLNYTTRDVGENPHKYFFGGIVAIQRQIPVFPQSPSADVMNFQMGLDAVLSSNFYPLLCGLFPLKLIDNCIYMMKEPKR